MKKINKLMQAYKAQDSENTIPEELLEMQAVEANCCGDGDCCYCDCCSGDAYDSF